MMIIKSDQAALLKDLVHKFEVMQAIPLVEEEKDGESRGSISSRSSQLSSRTSLRDKRTSIKP